ncbi:MAG: 50S ribosomal protein L33 [Candidatus Moranbacteria bacterium]|nr:50S ribosomal protein L33 [Candidatus Moranbacteria bacterium]
MGRIQDHYIKLKCSICKTEIINTKKNKKKLKEKLELNKFCKNCKKHTKFVEAKK